MQVNVIEKKLNRHVTVNKESGVKTHVDKDELVLFEKMIHEKEKHERHQKQYCENNKNNSKKKNHSVDALEISPFRDSVLMCGMVNYGNLNKTVSSDNNQAVEIAKKLLARIRTELACNEVATQTIQFNFSEGVLQNVNVMLSVTNNKLVVYLTYQTEQHFISKFTLLLQNGLEDLNMYDEVKVVFEEEENTFNLTKEGSDNNRESSQKQRLIDEWLDEQ